MFNYSITERMPPLMKTGNGSVTILFPVNDCYFTFRHLVLSDEQTCPMNRRVQFQVGDTSPADRITLNQLTEAVGQKGNDNEPVIG